LGEPLAERYLVYAVSNGTPSMVLNFIRRASSGRAQIPIAVPWASDKYCEG